MVNPPRSARVGPEGGHSRGGLTADGSATQRKTRKSGKTTKIGQGSGQKWTLARGIDGERLGCLLRTLETAASPPRSRLDGPPTRRTGREGLASNDQVATGKAFSGGDHSRSAAGERARGVGSRRCADEKAQGGGESTKICAAGPSVRPGLLWGRPFCGTGLSVGPAVLWGRAVCAAGLSLRRRAGSACGTGLCGRPATVVDPREIGRVASGCGGESTSLAGRPRRGTARFALERGWSRAKRAIEEMRTVRTGLRGEFGSCRCAGQPV